MDLLICVLLQSIYFLAEYCTPAKCLFDMVNKYTFAGLSQEELLRQGSLFKEKFEEIVNCQRVKAKKGDLSDKVKIILFREEGW